MYFKATFGVIALALISGFTTNASALTSASGYYYGASKASASKTSDKALVEVSKNSGAGLSFNAKAQIDGDLLEAFTSTESKFTNSGSVGYSSSDSVASFTDYISFVGNPYPHPQPIWVTFKASVQSNLVAEGTGSATYRFLSTFKQKDYSYTEQLASDMRSIPGGDKFTGNLTFERTFNLWTRDIYEFTTDLRSYSRENGFVDAHADVELSFIIPAGITLVSSLGRAYEITEGPASPAPEPATYAMFLAGMGLVGFVARRRLQS